jgi:hypothetical protein
MDGGIMWMKGQITRQDWERIEEFLKTPQYMREPEILIPNDDAAGPEDDEMSPSD